MLGGRVVHYNVDGTILSERYKADKIMSATPNKETGYVEIFLRYQRDGIQKSQRFSVHVIVCKIFHGRRPFPGAQVDHLDGVRHNNRWNNLRWASCSQQQETSKKLGTKPVGERHYKAVLTDDQIETIMSRYVPHDKYNSFAALALEYGVCKSTLSKIYNNVNRAGVM